MRYISLFGLLLRLILENPILQQIDNITCHINKTLLIQAFIKINLISIQLRIKFVSMFFIARRNKYSLKHKWNIKNEKNFHQGYIISHINHCTVYISQHAYLTIYTQYQMQAGVYFIKCVLLYMRRAVQNQQNKKHRLQTIMQYIYL